MSRLNEFSARIFKHSIATNIAGAYVLFFYSALFNAFRLGQLIYAFIICTVEIVFIEFVAFRFLLIHKSADLSEKIDLLYTENGFADINERTKLLTRLLRYPIRMYELTFVTFSFITLSLVLVYHYVEPIGIDWRTTLISLPPYIFGILTISLIAHSYGEYVCNKYTMRLVRQGVDIYYLRDNRIMGMSMKLRCIFYLVIPTVFPNIINFIVLYQGYNPINNTVISAKFQIVRIIIIASINLILSVVMWILYYINVRGKTKRLITTISQMLQNPRQEAAAATSLSDELQINIHLINSVIARFRMLIKQSENIGNEVLKTTDNLSIISKQVNSTSLEQSADVKAILTTMEDANSLSQNIASRVLNVSGGAETTKGDIQSGLEILNQNIEQMQQIGTANREILTGITNLTQQINSINEVVDLINEIADQTRIIAFNAELEAVSTGEKGKNFHIVATEIRRLAASTMNSIHEIQSYVKNIQTAASALINSSENTSKLLQEEKELSQELENQFNTITESSNLTFQKAKEIGEIVDQQTSSFNQIVITLKQISSGIESFTVSTKAISETANKMKGVASSLNSLNE